jgi:hypothetical protein
MAIHLVPTDLVADLWSAFEEHVEAACEHHPFMDAQDVMAITCEGRATLFIYVDGHKVRGFAVMEVIDFPRRSVANVLVCGGERGFLSVATHELLSELKKWGASKGADTFAILGGRPGWVRALRSQGFRTAPYVTLWADLDVEGRRQITDADNDQSAMGRSAALSH